MIHPNQVLAATTIMQSFLAGTRCALLKAQCQSGKTGTFQHLIKMLLNGGHITHAYIICGSSEIELRTQARDDTLEHNREYYRIDAKGIQSGEIEVIFHQDFKHAELNINNALIVIDESHMVQTKNQQLHGFLGVHGIKQNGDPTALFASNAYLLSVDATPYAEEAALYHKETPFPKKVVELMPGEGYFGLGDYKGNGLLRETFNIMDEPERFEALLDTIPRKFVLIRLTHGVMATAAEQEIRYICERKGFPFLLNTSEATQIAVTRKQQEQLTKERNHVSCMEDAPTITTIVIIRGRLRAGKVVPKKHVGFIWEGAAASKTDALVQGLPGRMCGYEFGEQKPILFVPPSALISHEDKVVKASEMERAIIGAPQMMPQKGTNLKVSRIGNVAMRGDTIVTPWLFSVMLPAEGVRRRDSDDDVTILPPQQEERYQSHEDMRMLGEHCRDALRMSLDTIRLDRRLSPEARDEILGIVANPATYAHVRQMVGSSQLDYYKQIVQADQDGTVPQEHIEGCPQMTFCVIFPGYEGLRSPNDVRRLYAIFYTNASPPIGKLAVNLKSRIPTTNGKSVFGADDTTHAVATIRTALTAAQIRTPVALEATLDLILTRWRESINTTMPMERIIHDEAGRFAFNKRTFHYESTKRNDVATICKRLETKFNIKIKVACVKGSETNFNVKTISWEPVV
jgi:hypothetical protein